MKSSQSIGTDLSGDWLVVIDRLEANVFRSTVSGSRSRCIRAQLREYGHELGHFRDFFELLASVLRGARRVVVFGRITPLGNEAGPFMFWLYDRYPELTGRVVASVPIDFNETDESALLAKARAFYERGPIARPKLSVPIGQKMIDLAREA